MFVKQLARRQSGDTIIEVMIVLAVLGLAIGLSYATANGSLLNLRQAQENSIATEMAQSQVESLRFLATNGSPTANIFTAGVPATNTFCIDTLNNTIILNPAAGSTACFQKSFYDIRITYVDPANDTFKVVVSWPDVHGDVTDTVTLFYRVHPS